MAFTALYATHAAGLERYIARIVHDRQVASDLTHDTLIKALERPASAPGWLYRVAHNAAVDHVRSSGRTTAEDPEAIDRRREQCAPPVDWGSAERVNAEVELLPKARREVMLLRYRTGLSTAETGAALGKTHAAVRQLEVRALRTLRIRLGAEV